MKSKNKPYSILYVDDESENLTGFKFLFRRFYNVYLAQSGNEALELLETTPVHLVLADQRMPKMTGAALLSKVYEKYPEVSRIIVTGYSDIDGIIEAVNKGGIYYYVTKPWNAEELRVIIDRALEAYQLRNDKRILIDDLKSSNTELDTFLYRSSHDLKRPIMTMLGLAKVAQMSIEGDSALDLFAKVEATALSMNKMLDKLYMVNDINLEGDQIVKTNTTVIINNILDSLKKRVDKQQANISLNLSADTNDIWINDLLLKNAIFNLIENALIFTAPQSPSISIHSHIEEIKNSPWLSVSVEDNGEGIPAEFMPRIFDMYVVASERTEGNGLGLYVFKKTVEKLGGTTSLQSTIHQGTSIGFKVPLPRVESALPTDTP